MLGLVHLMPSLGKGSLCCLDLVSSPRSVITDKWRGINDFHLLNTKLLNLLNHPGLLPSFPPPGPLMPKS